jgi:hypothetical protein
MAGIRPPDNAASPHRRNQLKASNVHYLFSVRNMFFLVNMAISALSQRPSGCPPVSGHRNRLGDTLEKHDQRPEDVYLDADQPA